MKRTKPTKKVRAVIYLYPQTYKWLREVAERSGMTASQKGAKIIFDMQQSTRGPQ